VFGGSDPGAGGLGEKRNQPFTTENRSENRHEDEQDFHTVTAVWFEFRKALTMA
jgi:hypothetical protein